MLGLGTILLGVTLIGSKIKEVIDDADMMSKPVRYLDDGTPVYIDSKCQQHINGEKVVPKVARDINGKVYLQEVGERSGRVYYDPYQDKLKREREEDKLKLQRALQSGYLSYEKYSPKYNRRITTEISTGKPIACLYEYSGEYRKFYLKESASEPNEIAPGDMGIAISKEEYNKLNVYYGYTSHKRLPDWDTMEKLDRLREENAKKERIKMYAKDREERLKRDREENSITYWGYM